MRAELPKTLPVSRVIEEARDIKTIFLPWSMSAVPGQFAMVWLPGVDSKPISISYQSKNLTGFTIKAIGPWSKQVCALNEGDLLGVFGPYGNSFKLKGKRIILCGGGYGAASLMLLAEKALKAGLETVMVIGARTEKDLIYRKRVGELGLKTYFCTDDGSFGFKGRVTEKLDEVLSGAKPECVYVCGPDQMEKAAAETCVKHNVESQISLERYMKCGFGVCGTCCLDPGGERVCVEGTVFSGAKLLQSKEFGNYHRDSSAKKIKI